MHLLVLPLLLPFALANTPGTDSESHPRPHTYALVVGSNMGGPGQASLRFAEDDARRFADVLLQLGHTSPDDVHVLLHPETSVVLGAIDELATRVKSNAANGEPSEVIFYYSGHARSSALTLGGQEIALTALRERLTALPSTLTIVVLDACQSGAFARVKGAEPAADFTYNSVSHLTQKGLAVMASSTSQELSQESDELAASYFTHHLVTALRGAGDADGDGRVSLDEAYRYAYRRTLASTARTQVGEQHVTLETDLAGQDDVAVTFPAEARAQLELPRALDARILVQQRPSGSVVADLQKAAGTPIRIALVAGGYEAIVRQASGIVQCHLALADNQVTSLETGNCTPVSEEKTASKGDGAVEHHVDTHSSGGSLWEVEGSFGFISTQSDGYVQTLQQFGYQHRGGLLGLPTGRYSLGVSRLIVPHIAAVLELETLGRDTYSREIANSTDSAVLSAYSGALYLRVFTDVIGQWLGVYAQLGGGATFGLLDFKTQQSGVTPSTTTTYFGYVLSGTVGLSLRLPRYATVFAQVGYERAPTVQNLIGDTHDSGGVVGLVGVRVRFGGEP
jgi:hypothetical protein